MATTSNKTASAPSAAKSAPAKAAPAPAKATAPAPQAPLFVMGPWPAKAQAGNSIRAYCANVAKALTKANPNGFTVAQYASALAANAQGTTYKQPSAGWGTAAAPNSNAKSHANYFANPAQGWLAPAGTPATKS